MLKLPVYCSEEPLPYVRLGLHAFSPFFSLCCRDVWINGNGMKEPSCGNERPLNRPSDLSSIFPGVSRFAVICLQLSQCSVLEFVIVILFIIG